MSAQHLMGAFVPAITGIKALANLRRCELSAASHLKCWQEKRMRSLLSHAFGTVPYYRSTFEAAGIKPNDIKTIEDLQHLPILRRDTAQGNTAALLSRRLEARERAALVNVRTTGSSGIPLEISLTRHEYYESLTHVLYGFLAAGASLRDSFIHIHVTQGPVPHFGFERFGFMRQVHLDLRKGPRTTLAELATHRSPVIYSFPSYLHLMADHIVEDNVAPPRVKLIICNGEHLSPTVRERIQNTFQCPVVDSYGAAEIFRIAYECRSGHLHILPSSIVEIDTKTLNSDGSADIIVTPLYLRAMPLVRYRLGDRIMLGRTPCPCGSRWNIITRVVGRSDDTLVLASGRRISARAINILETVPGVREYQIVQKTPSRFEVFIVPSPEFDTRAHDQIVNRIAAGCTPDRVEVAVRQVETIRRESTGKRSAVLSEVPH